MSLIPKSSYCAWGSSERSIKIIQDTYFRMTSPPTQVAKSLVKLT